MSATWRKRIYVALGFINFGLAASVQQHWFASAPTVASGVALASLAVATFMNAWHAPDQPVLPAAEATVISLVQKGK